MRIKTPKFRASYASVFEPRKPKKGDESKPAKYELCMIFPAGTDLAALKAAAMEVAEEKFGAKARDLIKAKKIKWPFHKGNDDKPEEPAFKDSEYLNARSKMRPGIVNEKLEDITTSDEFRSGDYARASVSFFGYDDESKGVGVLLYNIQRLGRGEPLDGRVDADKEFDDGEKPAASSGDDFDDL